MKEYTSIGQPTIIKNRGTIVIVEIDKDQSRSDINFELLGSVVKIDGQAYLVKGVESSCLEQVRQGDRIGLLVEEAN